MVVVPKSGGENAADEFMPATKRAIAAAQTVSELEALERGLKRLRDSGSEGSVPAVRPKLAPVILGPSPVPEEGPHPTTPVPVQFPAASSKAPSKAIPQGSVLFGSTYKARMSVPETTTKTKAPTGGAPKAKQWAKVGHERYKPLAPMAWCRPRPDGYETPPEAD